MSRFKFAFMFGCALLMLQWADAQRNLVHSQDNKSAEKTDTDSMKTLWDALEKEEPNSIRALLRLSKTPDATTSFFEKTLKPLTLDDDKFTATLKNLGSEDQATWQAAFHEFEYLDPRLYLGLEELMKRAQENPTRSRLVEVLSGRKMGSLDGQDIRLRRVNGDAGEDDYFNFSSGGSSWWAESKISRIGRNGWNSKKTWSRAVRAIVILESFETPEATKLLAKMARGHEQALPTQLARQVAMNFKKSKSKR